MQTYGAQFHIRVQRRERGPLERDLVDGFYIHDMPNEMQLRQRVCDVAEMNRPHLGDRCGVTPTPEQDALVDLATAAILTRLRALQPVGKPYQLLFEEESEHGTVTARLWTNVTLSANQPHRVTSERA